MVNYVLQGLTKLFNLLCASRAPPVVTPHLCGAFNYCHLVYWSNVLCPVWFLCVQPHFPYCFVYCLHILLGPAARGLFVHPCSKFVDGLL